MKNSNGHPAAATEALTGVFIDYTVKCLVFLRADMDIVRPLFLRTYRKEFQKIVDKSKETATQADFLQGLQQNRVDPLVAKAAEISLMEECLRYTKKLMTGR